MFAHYTSTSMKGSSVVQGLKSWASKFHPQLPLSPRESQRLLTALTTSFRRQLDQAHPTQVADDENKAGHSNEGVSKIGKQRIHSSSAALADRHLASILTNPLLAKDGVANTPETDYENAKLELQNNPSKDPILVLEECHKKGTATIPIAILCLQKFHERIKLLSGARKQEEILKIRAGKRALLWLWNSGLYEDDAFHDDLRFIDLMVLFVMKEGSDKYLWRWWEMDMRLQPKLRENSDISRKPRVTSAYNWKGRILRAMVATELREMNRTSADAAIDTFLKACALVTRNPDRYEWALRAAAYNLCTDLALKSPLATNTDPQRFDKFIASMDLWTTEQDHPSALSRRFRLAILWQHHPRSPSPLPAFKLLKDLFDPPNYNSKLYMDFTAPRSDKQRQNLYDFLKSTARLLQDEQRVEDANWVIVLAQQLYPKFAQSVHRHINEDRKSPHLARNTRDEAGSSEKISDVPEVPGFAFST